MRHLFIDASIDGTPEIDPEAGTVSGLKIVTDNYQVLDAGSSPCCDRIVGGRIHIEQGELRFELTTGKTKISPANFERASEPTASGRMMTMIKPKLSSMEIELANFCGGDPLTFFGTGKTGDQSDCNVSVTLVEEDR